MRDRPDLQALVAYWQKALRLLDWRIQAEYVADLKSSDGGLCYGLCYPFVDNKTARIEVRDPRTPIDAKRDPAVEETVIHELLHLWWAPAGFRTAAEIAHEENAVWAISEALVAHKGSGQELRLARAMMSALGPKSTSGTRGSRREQAMDLATLLAALEAAVESGDMKQVEALIAKIKEAQGGGGGGEGEPPPPEQGRPQGEPDKDKPADDKDRGQRIPAQRPRAQQSSTSSGSDDVRAQLAELDGFKRDMLLDQRGSVLPEMQRKWAATQPYAVVKGLIDATPATTTEPRAARGSSPTRGAGKGGSAPDHNSSEVDRRMGVARTETPAVMIDPNTNKLFISALKPVTVGVAGEVK